MAPITVRNVILVAGLSIFASCFFSSQIVSAKNISGAVDLGVILTTPAGDEKWKMVSIVSKLLEHVEMGENKVKIALVESMAEENAVDTTDWLFQPLTADEALVKKRLNEWKEITLQNPTASFAKAFLALKPVFEKSGGRFKAVFFVKPPMAVDPTKTLEMLAAPAKQIRDVGGHIYLLVPDDAPDDVEAAKNVTGNPNQVFGYKEEDVKTPTDLLTRVFDQMSKDVEKPATPTPSPPPAPAPTTTSGAAGSIPVLQWVIGLLIGERFVVRPFTF